MDREINKMRSLRAKFLSCSSFNNNLQKYSLHKQVPKRLKSLGRPRPPFQPDAPVCEYEITSKFNNGARVGKGWIPREFNDDARVEDGWIPREFNDDARVEEGWIPLESNKDARIGDRPATVSSVCSRNYDGLVSSSDSQSSRNKDADARVLNKETYPDSDNLESMFAGSEASMSIDSDSSQDQPLNNGHTRDQVEGVEEGGGRGGGAEEMQTSDSNNLFIINLKRELTNNKLLEENRRFNNLVKQKSLQIEQNIHDDKFVKKYSTYSSTLTFLHSVFKKYSCHYARIIV